MDLIKLNIRGISYSQNQVGAYVLILEEEVGGRKLPIIIGNSEAQAIAIGLDRDLQPSRPLTHDLFLKIAHEVRISIQSVIIYKLEEGIFYANILFEDIDGNVFEVDARTSDAIALAVRFKAPIYAMKHVVDKAGISMQIISDKDKEEVDKAIEELEEELRSIMPGTPSSSGQWSRYSLEELKNMMEKAVAEENYELAAQLRDEIELREK